MVRLRRKPAHSAAFRVEKPKNMVLGPLFRDPFSGPVPRAGPRPFFSFQATFSLRFRPPSRGVVFSFPATFFFSFRPPGRGVFVSFPATFFFSFGLRGPSWLETKKKTPPAFPRPTKHMSEKCLKNVHLRSKIVAPTNETHPYENI